MEITTRNAFKLEDGNEFAGLNLAAYESTLAELESQNGLSLLQLAEASGMSGAMVLRVALGLSASGAAITALVDDCRAGYITLSLLRQLANAGSMITVFTAGMVSEDSPFGRQLFALSISGANLLSLEHTTPDEFTGVMTNSHAFVFGTFQGAFSKSEVFASLCAQINDHQIPVHTIEFPPGVCPETGERQKAPVFAATTIVPGIPLSSLAPAADFAGRMYVCDISIPRSTYQAIAPGMQDIFSRQPVNQIFLNKAEPAA